ncbi:hypothetical protein ALC56_12330, partial [Trachymyrmex septentrionalis]
VRAAKRIVRISRFSKRSTKVILSRGYLFNIITAHLCECSCIHITVDIITDISSFSSQTSFPRSWQQIESIEGSRARIFPTLHPITVEAVKWLKRETADSRNEIYLVE